MTGSCRCCRWNAGTALAQVETQVWACKNSDLDFYLAPLCVLHHNACFYSRARPEDSQSLDHDLQILAGIILRFAV